MKTRLNFPVVASIWLAGLAQFASATVSFTVSPTAISNTCNGNISLQITGLTNSETVLVQKSLDVNANGAIDSGDWLLQQLKLTGGSSSLRYPRWTNLSGHIYRLKFL